MTAEARAATRSAVASASPVDVASLLLPSLRPIPGINLAARHLPAAGGAAEVGDFYDAFETGRVSTGVVMGDVCGTGMEAAVVARFARDVLRRAARSSASPSRNLAMLNQTLIDRARGRGDEFEPDRFLSAAYLTLRPTTTGFTATLCLAGHPPALLRTAEGLVSEVGHTGSILGVFPSPDLGLRETRVRLEPGDALVLYTDGVTEARRGDEFYGTERLSQVFHAAKGLDAEALSAHIVDVVVAFSGGDLRDDTAVLVLQVPREPVMAESGEITARLGVQRTVKRASTEPASRH